MLAALLVSFVAAGLLAPTSALADVFRPISFVSEGALGSGEPQEAEYAHDTAISGNGRYVAFDGSIGGVSGVWRRDLATGALEQVAGGDVELPSLSENGQLISFTTNEGASLAKITDGEPDLEPKPEAVNVYMRDMTKAPSEPGAFILVSAVDGSEEALTYSGAGTTLGSAATGRSAISANGNEVAFVTTAVSNLVRYPALEEEEEQKGETPKPHTPALQVAVRFPETRETELVSRCYVAAKCAPGAEPAVATEEGGQTTGGAVYPGSTAAFRPAPAYGEYGTSAPVGASISADGSTVAWMGENVGQQALRLNSETEEKSAHYTEPLWRRIEPGSETPTERVTGGSEPTNPACAASGETQLPSPPSATDPCQGPFAATTIGRPGGILAFGAGPTGDFVPRLSADGNTVAFVSQAPLVTLGENFNRGDTGQPSDLYVVNMSPGLTRDQALTPLTALAGGEGAGPAGVAPIFDFDISPDGSQVAFVTRRTEFPLGSPAYVSPPAAEPGLNELFDVDLTNDTLTRVTHGYGGPDEPAEHPHGPKSIGVDPYEHSGDGALSPSFSESGSMLAFTSTASNLVYGDASSPPAGRGEALDGSEAYAVQRTTFPPVPTEQFVSTPPQNAIAPAWQLGVTVLSRPDGSVLLYIQAPGAGALSANARSQVPLSPTGHIAVLARHAPSLHSHASRKVGRRRNLPSVATRTVASVGVTPTTGGSEPVTLVLQLAKPYAVLAAQRDGLSASASIIFVASGRPTLREEITVHFIRAAGRSKRASAHRAGRRTVHKGARR